MSYLYEHWLTNILALMNFQKRYFEDDEENIEATVYKLQHARMVVDRGTN
jgi:hypothetical protein